MGDLAQLKDRIFNYQLDGSNLGNLGYTRILLQICGPTGNGKSSLINSFKYALYDQKFSILAPVAPAQESLGGFTTKRLSYELTKVITLVDNRGFGKSDSFEKEEVYAQLANFQPLDVEVTWDRSYEYRMDEVISSALNTNDLLVPIYVHSAATQIPEGDKKEMVEFFQTINKLTGFLPIVVLTNRLSPNAEKMHKQFKAMGVESVFEVENYINEDHNKTIGKDRSFLTILSALLDMVDFVSNKVVPILESPEQEHRKRMKVLLKMAHDNDMERRERERLKENVPRQTPPPQKKGALSC
ncbi:hypothetical protein PRIEUP_LOCUS486, partial [Pristimantis euphronides]